MDAEARLNELLESYQDDPDFLTEELLLDVTEQVSLRLRELGMRPSDLAQRLGVSRSFISQLLNGRPNMTVRTLVGVAHALDQRVSVKLESRRAARIGVASFNRPFRHVLPENEHASALAA